jgi:Ca-activated chloride channel homolog
MKIDPQEQAKLPHVAPAVPFLGGDGRFRGWKVAIPGRHTLATPALSDGRVFLGGGFASYDFYAFDAVDGSLSWQYRTTDDGPTAAVVVDGHVVFNTESCELEVLTLEGASVWKKWLGDPLTSIPAVDQGRIYMAYPDSKADHQHHLACFDLRTGHEYWKQPIEGEIITAPVLAEDRVHFVTLGGTLYRVRQEDGHIDWKEQRNATSSPVVWGGECYFSQREAMPEVDPTQGEVYQSEHLAARKLDDATFRQYRTTSRKADYLDHLKRMRGSPRYAASELMDHGVGFAHAKGGAKMHQAMGNLGHAQVHSVWAYQGSKPFASRGRLYAAHGDVVSAVDPGSDQVFWKKTIGPTRVEGQELLDSPLTPPAIVNGKLFLGSIHGAIHCLSAETGEELWTVNVGEPVIFQPAVAGGRVYVGTDSGTLVCFETGDPDDDGWLMWGANASHNGLMA